MCVLLASPPTALAAELTFDLNPTCSEISLATYATALDAFSEPQGFGSETTSFTGTMTIDIDSAENPTQIQFIDANIVANINGEWLPEEGGGNEGSDVDGDADPGDPRPADFGLQFIAAGVGELFGALREVEMSISSDVIDIFGEGMFGAGQTVTTTHGFLDYNISSPLVGDDAGQEDMTRPDDDNHFLPKPNLGDAGQWIVSKDRITLSIPIRLDHLDPDGDFDFFMGGVLVASLGGGEVLGDANGDCLADGRDLEIWHDHLFTTGTDLSTGDFDGNGVTDVADFNVWNDHRVLPFGAGAASVPEPAGLQIVMLATLILLFAKRFAVTTS